jgi:hypothetical protein
MVADDLRADEETMKIFWSYVPQLIQGSMRDELWEDAKKTIV